MADNEPKQVLIWRNDLRNVQGQKVRTGKICAQLAHASMKAILNVGFWENDENRQCLFIPIDKNEALTKWLQGRFTKVCVSVDSESELLDIYNAAVAADIKCRAIIEDAGLTEFDGVKTLTAAAIGPAFPEEIDKITGHLKLL